MNLLHRAYAGVHHHVSVKVDLQDVVFRYFQRGQGARPEEGPLAFRVSEPHVLKVVKRALCADPDHVLQDFVEAMLPLANFILPSTPLTTMAQILLPLRRDNNHTGRNFI